MPKKANDVERALRKKGFVESNKSHKVYSLYVNGKKTSIITHTSHGSTHKEINDSILNIMANQMKITRKEFDDFVKCTLSEEMYVNLLITRGLIKI